MSPKPAKMWCGTCGTFMDHESSLERWYCQTCGYEILDKPPPPSMYTPAKSTPGGNAEGKPEGEGGGGGGGGKLTVALIRSAIEKDLADGYDTPIEFDIPRADWDRIGEELGVKKTSRTKYVTERAMRTKAGWLTLKLADK